MILYEVNIQLKPNILSEFSIWLQTHIKEMLELPGFMEAKLFSGEQNEHTEQLIVHYYLKDQQAMEHYLKELAPKMRADGIEKFETSFQINRRILKYLQ